VDVVVVGSIGLDTIETPFEKRRDLLGGSVSYACAASAFLSSVGMVGVVGTDFPPACRDVYRRFGIDLEGLALVAGKTFRWSGIYEADMINRRTISTELNVFERFSPELPASYAKAPFFLLGNISPELQLRVLQQAQSPVFVVADTMDLWIRMARKPLNQVIRRVHMLMLNDAEARQLTGRYNLVECARDILAMGPRYVVIKKGEHGAMLVSKAGVFLVPAYPVDVVRDPTGAGDSFAGGFLGALAQARAGGRGAIRESEVRQALLYGSVIASFNVEDFSLNRLQVLKRSDVEARLRQLKQMMSVT
jgi:sugar/nucleoside kinase (ribokinase family)